MKVFAIITFVLLLMKIEAKTRCKEKSGIFQGLQCKGIKFQAGKPVNISWVGDVSITNSTGFISKETLSPLSGVRLLIITRSSIYHIDDGALCSLPNFNSLQLSYNDEFPVLTDSLLRNCKSKMIQTDGLVDLHATKYIKGGVKKLRVYNETIFHLTKEYLQQLNHLDEIQISKCIIKKIDPGVFCLSPVLNTLVIRENKIYSPLTELTFECCSSVTDFMLKGSKNTIVEDNAFRGFQKVRVVKFHNLDIEHLTKEYLNGLSSVQTLEIIRCGITKLSTDTFEGFQNLKHLSLGHNQLKEIDPVILDSMPRLEKLDLSSNHLTSLDNFKHLKLKKLILNSNLIKVMDAEAVKLNLPRLESLRLGYNGTVIKFKRQ